jgi:hypothetical protein
MMLEERNQAICEIDISSTASNSQDCHENENVLVQPEELSILLEERNSQENENVPQEQLFYSSLDIIE